MAQKHLKIATLKRGAAGFGLTLLLHLAGPTSPRPAAHPANPAAKNSTACVSSSSPPLAKSRVKSGEFAGWQCRLPSASDPLPRRANLWLLPATATRTADRDPIDGEQVEEEGCGRGGRRSERQRRTRERAAEATKGKAPDRFLPAQRGGC
jgi:hypothetical protein